MTATVLVVCDNAKHAGKVAKVSTFYVLDGKVKTRINGIKRRGRRHHRLTTEPTSPKAFDFFMKGETSKAACNLCGRELPDDARVNRAVELVAERSGHEHTVSLSDIAAIIFRLEA